MTSGLSGIEHFEIRDGHFWKFLISIIDREGRVLEAGHGRNGDNENLKTVIKMNVKNKNMT